MTLTIYRVFTGPNGQYVTREDDRGFHHQPADGGAANGWGRKEILQRRADRLNGRCDSDDIDDDLRKTRAGVYRD